MPTTSTVGPRVVLDDVTLGDVELALLGVLPVDHVLGGVVRVGSPVTGATVLLPRGLDGSGHPSGELLLVDEECTPLATLIVQEAVPCEGGSDLLRGLLRRERARESGAGGPRLDEAALLADWHLVVILSRPLTTDELPPWERGRVLLLVPDSRQSTDGIPTAVLLDMARHLAPEVGSDVTIRTAPLRWRDPASDTALGDLLAARLGAPVDLRHPSPDVDPRAVGWRDVRAALDSAVRDDPLDRVPDSVDQALRRWRPPRPRRGVVVMFTGLSGSGKSTLARSVRDALLETSSRTVSLLDGDAVRGLLSSGLGFDRVGREQNIRRIGFVATEVARHGGLVLCAPIAPYRSTRAEVRAMVREVGDFVLVHVSTPLETCEARDFKGLYAAARAGRIREFTGVSDPYESPDDADLVVDTTVMRVAEATAVVLAHLQTGGWLSEEIR
ncbi:adenylyl-sulfate kinase [Knoellia sp. CPCC 206453]|uniref:adenylyl-sulfate kinase n=1 Tax=Knoellia pratensis TaxID=3404796 RepID=UPI003623F24A